MAEPPEAKRPGTMQRLWEGWKRVAKRIGDFQVRLLLLLFYFLVLAPFALAVRWFSDPLSIKIGSPRGWQLKSQDKGPSMGRALRQF
jgi:hypothetical protein